VNYTENKMYDATILKIITLVIAAVVVAVLVFVMYKYTKEM
jgi:uncharacterized membrane-anchored protein